MDYLERTSARASVFLFVMIVHDKRQLALKIHYILTVLFLLRILEMRLKATCKFLITFLP